jgi:hypothetical protein
MFYFEVNTIVYTAMEIWDSLVGIPLRPCLLLWYFHRRKFGDGRGFDEFLPFTQSPQIIFHPNPIH